MPDQVADYTDVVGRVREFVASEERESRQEVSLDAVVLGIERLNAARSLADEYAQIVPGLAPAMDLMAYIERHKLTVTETLGAMTPEDRLEAALSGITVFNDRADWGRARFLSEAIFRTAKDISPAEEQDIATLFCHVAAQISKPEVRAEYLRQAAQDAVRHKNDHAAVTFMAQLITIPAAPTKAAGDFDSGIFIRPALGSTTGDLNRPYVVSASSAPSP
ncbi:MAG: hypothetical protein V4621_04590 [Pseudomonadota bacterium]